jgi:hypothetical protein
MFNLQPRSHLIASIRKALTVRMCAELLVAPGEVRSRSAPRPESVDSDGITVIGTHDSPPIVDHFNLPRTFCAPGMGSMMTSDSIVRHDRGG